MKTHFIASEEQFVDHLLPIWAALEDPGHFWVTPNLAEYAPDAEELPRWLKVDRGDIIAVAAENDRKRAEGIPTIRFEHGCGLSYAGAVEIPPGAPRRALAQVAVHQSYPGGRNQQGVKAFLSPNRYAADRWREAYPYTPVEIVGTPRLDEFHNAEPKPRSDRPVVAISFHVNINVSPETESAFPFYRGVVPQIAERDDLEVIGHSHPRARAERRAFFEELGIEFVDSFADVMRRADVYAVDNSSTLYEFASLDRPVVVVNAPQYRRDVHHGLRFWEHSDVGVNCDAPSDLSAAIDRALEDPDEVRAARAAATEDIYPYRGRAAVRAAEAIAALDVVPVG